MPSTSSSGKSNAGALNLSGAPSDPITPADMVPAENTFGRWKIGRASFRHIPSSRKNKTGQNKDDSGAADDTCPDDGEGGKKVQRIHSHSEVPALPAQKQIQREGSFFRRTVKKKMDSLSSPHQVVELREPSDQPEAEQFGRISLSPAEYVAASVAAAEGKTKCGQQDGNNRAGDKAPEVTFKVMLIGDSGVGKTCLLVQYKDGKYLAGNFIATVGMDFKNKTVCVDDTTVKLQIWDTAGQERFRSVTHSYYRDAQALLLLYDVTNRNTFANTRAWLTEIREHANRNVVIFLVGNKSDCTSRREVTKEDGETLASECDVAFAETSARTGANVEIVFDAVARELLHRWKLNPQGGRTTFDMKAYVASEVDKSDASQNGANAWKCFCT